MRITPDNRENYVRSVRAHRQTSTRCFTSLVATIRQRRALSLATSPYRIAVSTCVLHWAAVCVLLVITCGALPSAFGEDLASSTFSSGTEGWSVISLQRDGPGENHYSADWNSSGGYPGGYISKVDPDSWGPWYWMAPSSFLGDVSSAYNGILSYHLRQSDTSDQFDGPGLLLAGGCMTLVVPPPYHPATHWTPYQASLHESAGWVHVETGEPATRSDLLLLLSNLDRLLIRGEYHDGSDVGSLDSVVLSTPQHDCVTLFTERTPFLTATGTPSALIDFETFGDGTPVVGMVDVAGDEWSNLGVAFAPLLPDTTLRVKEGTSNWTPASPTHALSCNPGATCSFVITFSPPVSSFGFMLCDNGTTSTAEQLVVLDASGSALAQFPLPYYGASVSGPEGNFFMGFSSCVPIASVVIEEDPSDGDAFVLDDVMFTLAVPAGPGELAGTVVDGATAWPINGADVSVDDSLFTQTNEEGYFSFAEVSAGQVTIAANAPGYYGAAQTVIIWGGSLTTADISMTPVAGFAVTDVRSRFSSSDRRAHYLDGIMLSEQFTATVDWCGLAPGYVHWITPTGSYDDPCPGTTVTRAFDMGAEFGSGGTLSVVAVSNDDPPVESEPRLAAIIVAPVPPGLSPLDLTPNLVGNTLKYTTEGGLSEMILEAGV